MLENLGKPEHLLLVLFVVLLLFGAKRLPDLAKAVGKSVKILKDEVKDLHDDDRPVDTPPPAAAAVPDRDPATRAQVTDDIEQKQV